MYKIYIVKCSNSGRNSTLTESRFNILHELPKCVLGLILGGPAGRSRMIKNCTIIFSRSADLLGPKLAEEHLVDQKSDPT